MSPQEPGTGFTNFASTQRPALLARAYQLCGDWQEAEDLVQETLIKLYPRWLCLIGRGQPVSYSYRVLAHTFVDVRRRKHAVREVPYAELWDVDETTPASADGAETLLTMRSALRQLGNRQRAILLMRYWADMPIDEVADRLGITSGTVASQSHRALARLRTILEKTD